MLLRRFAGVVRRSVEQSMAGFIGNSFIQFVGSLTSLQLIRDLAVVVAEC